jgi:exoribonuclease R
MADHCNEKKMGSKKAQERSDRVYLSLYVKDRPIRNSMALVVGVGESSFTVLIPGMGIESRVYLMDHDDLFDYRAEDESSEEGKVISVTPNQQYVVDSNLEWRVLKIKLLERVSVDIVCKEESPIDIKIRLNGPWID